jgi:hypothetical protein
MSSSKKKSVTLKHAKKRVVTARTATIASGAEGLLANVGAELGSIVLHLELVESYVIVAELALHGQGAEQDCEIATLLQRGVGDLLFNQIRELAKVASKCDGLPPEPDYDSGNENDDGGVK